MAKATRRAKTAKKSVEVNDLPPTTTVKTARARRIVNTRAMTPGFPSATLASTPGGLMARKKAAAKKTGTKKKAAKKNPAKSRKAAKKSVSLKNLKTKAVKSAKAAITAVRQRLV